MHFTDYPNPLFRVCAGPKKKKKKSESDLNSKITVKQAFSISQSANQKKKIWHPCKISYILILKN